MGRMKAEMKEAWVIYDKDETPLDIALTLETAKKKAVALFNIPINDHSWGVNVGGLVGCWNIEGDKVFCKIAKHEMEIMFLRYEQEKDLGLR